MGPGGMRTYSNDTATSSGGILYSTAVTFYPTCPNEADLKEAEAERLKEIEYLESMMYERADYEDKKISLHHREVKRARRAPVKHKKPHMNRRIIR